MPTLIPRLKASLKEAVSAHVSQLGDGFSEKGFYGYALLTDSDVSSLGPVSNREADLKLKPNDKRYAYYRCCVDEWKNWKDFEDAKLG